MVLNFWASWCAPCRREMPVLIRLQEQYREAGLIVVGVNIEEARSPAGDFAAEFGINFALPMDFDGAVTRTLRHRRDAGAAAHDVPGTPTA